MIKEFIAQTADEIVTKLPEECTQFAATWSEEGECWDISYAEAQTECSPDGNEIA